MSGALLTAVNKMQADLAGLTHPHARPPTAARTSPTEVLSSVFHGESGSLHFLWDDPAPVPAAQNLWDPPSPGPHTGGAIPQHFLGGRPIGPPLSLMDAGVTVPIASGQVTQGAVAVPPPSVGPVEQAGESIIGLFG